MRTGAGTHVCAEPLEAYDDSVVSPPVTLSGRWSSVGVGTAGFGEDPKHDRRWRRHSFASIAQRALRRHSTTATKPRRYNSGCARSIARRNRNGSKAQAQAHWPACGRDRLVVACQCSADVGVLNIDGKTVQPSRRVVCKAAS